MRRDGIIMSITGDRHDIQRVNISALCRAKSREVFFLFLESFYIQVKCAKGKIPKASRLKYFTRKLMRAEQFQPSVCLC